MNQFTRLALGLSMAAGVWLGCKQNANPNQPTTDTLDSTGVGPHVLHRHESGHHPVTGEDAWDSINQLVHGDRHSSPEGMEMEYKTFGWHPYFLGSAYKSFNYRLLWGLAYFAYEVNPATGGYKDIHEWNTTEMVDSAKKYGTEVHLAVGNFGADANAQFLGNPKAWDVLADSLTVLLRRRDAQGVNLDFEEIPKGQTQNFTRFVTHLSQRLKAANPAWKVSLALYTVDWNKVFDIPSLNGAVDFYTLMGYDYYYAGSPQAGPVDPLASSPGFAPFNLESSVAFYLNEGLPKEKFILGLPYYGRQWEVQAGSNLPNKTLKYVNSPGIQTILQTYPTAKADFNAQMSTKYYEYTENGLTKQIWFSDTAALGPKFDYVKEQGLAGIAIWALGMDHGTTQFWELIERKFAK